LRRLEQVSFGSDAWPVWDLIGILILPGTIHLKAVMDGELVGFVGGDIRPAENAGWVATLAVLPRYRRMGVATALLHACEAGIQLRAVRLSVRRSNDAAAALYHREGYRMVDLWPNYYHDGEDAMVMEKKLRP
jgi:ribosomal protein S18 acetylase RimI-like enzyme